MWAQRSLDRVLGWLEAKRNWVYLERAKGKSPLPKRESAEPQEDLSDLSPLEQQRAYNEKHGIFVGVDPAVPGGDETAEVVVSFDPIQRTRTWSYSSWNSKTDEITHHPDPSLASWDGGKAGEDMGEDAQKAAIDRMRELSEAPEVYRPDPGMAKVLQEIKTDEELREIAKRKLAYVKATTPEQRAADAKAGRKPWEVG
jgi:hypothetical protein